MDPIADLENDHRKVQELLAPFEQPDADPMDERVDTIIRELSVHAAAEEIVIYPAVERLVPGGENMSAQHLREHQLVKEVLVGLERGGPEERKPLLATLAVYVRHHVEHEEGSLFPSLRQHASAEELDDIGRTLADAKEAAPTHPHPHAPDKPPAVLAAGAAAALVDRMRDAIAGRG